MKTRAHGPRLLLPAAIGVTLALGMLAVGQTSAGGMPPVGLGTAEPFAVLAGEEVTNTGPTTVTGNLGVHPGSSVSGFPPGTVFGTIHEADAVALAAKNALVTAYDDAAGRSSTVVTSGILTGQTLVAGAYNSDGASFNLAGPLTLDGQNDPNAVWIFQASSELITASASSVVFIRGGQPCNVFWQITSSATLGSGSSMVGTLMALQSITSEGGVTLNGRALARNGNVTLINDTITRSTCSVAATPSPTPTTTVPAPTATPQLPDAAFAEDTEAVAGWSVIAIIGAVALVISLREIVVTRRRSAAQRR